MKLAVIFVTCVFLLEFGISFKIDLIDRFKRAGTTTKIPITTNKTTNATTVYVPPVYYSFSDLRQKEMKEGFPPIMYMKEDCPYKDQLKVRGYPEDLCILRCQDLVSLKRITYYMDKCKDGVIKRKNKRQDQPPSGRTCRCPKYFYPISKDGPCKTYSYCLNYGKMEIPIMEDYYQSYFEPAQ